MAKSTFTLRNCDDVVDRNKRWRNVFVPILTDAFSQRLEIFTALLTGENLVSNEVVEVSFGMWH